MPRVRLAVYTDYPYHRIDGAVYAERAFAVFLASLAAELGALTVIGRLDPDSDKGRYPLGEDVSLVPLPHYPSLGDPIPALRGMVGAIGCFWHALGDIDCVWVLGPHPLAFAFTLLAWMRGKRVVLGAREQLPDYIRHRHPGKRLFLLAAYAMQAAFRAFGRFAPVVAVGPAIADGYRHSKRLLEISVSLVDEADLVEPDVAAKRDYGGELRVLSVGRLDPEKNPLMLADVLRILVDHDPRWRLVVCGEGSMEGELERRLEDLGVAENAELKGYVPLDQGLKEEYRASHALLHVSWTEGLPQVLFEAFAAGVPAVATDVGGVKAAVGSAARLVPAGDPKAAATALREIGEDAELRNRLISAGHELAEQTTLQRECRRVADFVAMR
jgi:glycosyltransferase involved in cell wall biosynthesis